MSRAESPNRWGVRIDTVGDVSDEMLYLDDVPTDSHIKPLTRTPAYNITLKYLRGTVEGRRSTRGTPTWWTPSCLRARGPAAPAASHHIATEHV